MEWPSIICVCNGAFFNPLWMMNTRIWKRQCGCVLFLSTIQLSLGSWWACFWSEFCSSYVDCCSCTYTGSSSGTSMGCRRSSRSFIMLLKSLCLGILNIAAKTSGKELIRLFSAMRPLKQHCHKNSLANLNRLQIKITSISASMNFIPLYIDSQLDSWISCIEVRRQK